MRRARAILSTLSLALTASAANAQEEPGYPIEEFLSVTSISEIAVSPDGRYVALISRKDDFQRNEPESTIWRIDLDERGRPTATVRLAASAPSYSQLGWSADSRYLAFLSGGASGESNHVYVLDMRGGEALRLTDPEQFSDGVATYDWMPDGTAIVFAAPLPQTPEEKEAYETLYGDVMRFADEPHAMTIERIPVSLKDTEATRLARVSIWVQSLKVAPGGRLAALLSTAPTKPQRFYNGLSQTEIFLLPLQGDGSLRRLTSNFISEGTIQWRRDGDGLYVNGLGYLNETRGRWTQGRIFAVTLDGAMRRVASDFTGSWAQAQQMPDGTLLGGAVLSTRANLYRIDPRSERPEPLTDYRGAVSDLSVSRDGSIIAFALVTDRSAPEVYVARGVRNIGKAERVTDLNADFNAMPRPEIEAIRWPNGEGDEIEGILFWPAGRAGPTAGRGHPRWPVVGQNREPGTVQLRLLSGTARIARIPGARAQLPWRHRAWRRVSARYRRLLVLTAGHRHLVWRRLPDRAGLGRPRSYGGDGLQLRRSDDELPDHTNRPLPGGRLGCRPLERHILFRYSG